MTPDSATVPLQPTRLTTGPLPASDRLFDLASTLVHAAEYAREHERNGTDPETVEQLCLMARDSLSMITGQYARERMLRNAKAATRNGVGFPPLPDDRPAAGCFSPKSLDSLEQAEREGRP